LFRLSGLAVKPKEVEMSTQQTENRFIVPIGPQHPALKEPGHFEFVVDGEIVTGASVRLGYVHRGIEKGAEDRTWTQNLYLMERICGICSHIHATAFVQGVEKLAGVEAPPRARAIREIFAELERIHSHMLWLGVAAHEGGFDALFMYSWRDREVVMDMLEMLSGNRVHYSANLIGGVKYDLTPEMMDKIRDGLNYLEERLLHYLNVVNNDETFIGRTRGIGTMTREQAQLLGAVGPTARASNFAYDVRVDAPYAAYAEFPVEMVVAEEGDLHARFVVRILETMESIRVLRRIFDNLPESELVTRVPRRIPAGETISRVEAPRGELFYFIASNGGEKPERVKVRTPSLCNWGTVITLAVGHKLADMPMILAGIDPCFSCNDRLVMVRRNQRDPQVWTWADLRNYGIEYYR
jgi:NADH-quinone oxidoreductase subunit D